jgi:hypothetical protein
MPKLPLLSKAEGRLPAADRVRSIFSVDASLLALQRCY